MGQLKYSYLLAAILERVTAHSNRIVDWRFGDGATKKRGHYVRTHPSADKFGKRACQDLGTSPAARAHWNTGELLRFGRFFCQSRSRVRPNRRNFPSAVAAFSDSRRAHD